MIRTSVMKELSEWSSISHKRIRNIKRLNSLINSLNIRSEFGTDALWHHLCGFQIFYDFTKKSQRRGSRTDTTSKVEFFMLIVNGGFSHSDWIWRDTEYLSVFSPNTRKYGPEITLYLDTFHTVWVDITSFRLLLVRFESLRNLA